MEFADILFLVAAEFLLLLAVVAMKLRAWRNDVLSGRYFHEDGRQPTLGEGGAACRPGAMAAAEPPHADSETGRMPERPLDANRVRTRPPLMTLLSLFKRRVRSHRPTAVDRKLSLSRHGRGIQGRADARPHQTNIMVTSPQIVQSAAPLPSGVRIYAIGDIHGRADLLAKILETIDVDVRERPVARPVLVFVGDYIDRGPSSKQVLDLLLECRRSRECIFLRGNHETFIFDFLDDPEILDEWRLYGGLETLLSYGLKPSFSPDKRERSRLAEELAAAISGEQRAFLDSLQLSYQCGSFVFVHAGLRPGIPIAKQDARDMLWIREEFLSHEQPFELFVVHGHTPVRTPDLRTNRLNIDTGAFATGCLTCAVIEGPTIMLLSTAVGDVPTAPVPIATQTVLRGPVP